MSELPRTKSGSHRRAKEQTSGKKIMEKDTTLKGRAVDCKEATQSISKQKDSHKETIHQEDAKPKKNLKAKKCKAERSTHMLTDCSTAMKKELMVLIDKCQHDLTGKVSPLQVKMIFENLLTEEKWKSLESVAEEDQLKELFAIIRQQATLDDIFHLCQLAKILLGDQCEGYPPRHYFDLMSIRTYFFSQDLTETIEKVITEEILDDCVTEKICRASEEEERQEILFQCLKMADVATFEKFANILRDTNQAELYHALKYAYIEEGMKHTDILSAKKRALLTHLDVDSMLDSIKSEETQRKFRNILQRTINKEKAKERIHEYLMNQDDATYRQFLYALSQSKQRHLLCLLEGQGYIHFEVKENDGKSTDLVSLINFLQKISDHRSTCDASERQIVYHLAELGIRLRGSFRGSVFMATKLEKVPAMLLGVSDWIMKQLRRIFKIFLCGKEVFSSSSGQDQGNNAVQLMPLPASPVEQGNNAVQLMPLPASPVEQENNAVQLMRPPAPPVEPGNNAIQLMLPPAPPVEPDDEARCINKEQMDMFEMKQMACEPKSVPRLVEQMQQRAMQIKGGCWSKKQAAGVHNIIGNINEGQTAEFLNNLYLQSDPDEIEEAIQEIQNEEIAYKGCFEALAANENECIKSIASDVLIEQFWADGIFTDEERSLTLSSGDLKERNKMFLRFLKNKGRNSFVHFIVGLDRTGHERVSDMFRPRGEDISNWEEMSVEEHAILRKRHEDIIWDLSQLKVLPYMRETGIFSDFDCHRVLAAGDSFKRNRVFMHILHTKGNGTLHVFSKALRSTDQKQIADQLVSTKYLPSGGECGRRLASTKK